MKIIPNYANYGYFMNNKTQQDKHDNLLNKTNNLNFTAKFNPYTVIKSAKYRKEKYDEYYESKEKELEEYRKKLEERKELPQVKRTPAQHMSEEELDKSMNIYVNADIKLNNNTLTVTNKEGKTMNIEIAEEYFEGVEDKERQIKIWLIDSIKNWDIDNVPLEILDVEDQIISGNVRNGLIKSYAQCYREALNNGIKIGKIINQEDGSYDVNLNIDGEKYKFKSYKPSKNAVLNSIICSEKSYDYSESIAKMIDNIKKTQSGFFVRHRNLEYYVPNIYKKIPDIKNDMVAIEHGNAITENNPVTKIVCEKLSQITGQDVNLDNLKTINYLTRTHDGYDNNICQCAYSFHDSVNDVHYMYKAENDALKIMAPNGYVMTKKLINSFDQK